MDTFMGSGVTWINMPMTFIEFRGISIRQYDRENITNNNKSRLLHLSRVYINFELICTPGQCAYMTANNKCFLIH